MLGLKNTGIGYKPKFPAEGPTGMQGISCNMGIPGVTGPVGEPGIPGLYSPIGYVNDYVLLFQKAFAAWWIGRYQESREIFFSMPDDFRLNEEYTKLVQNNMNILGIGNYPFLPYTSDMKEKLRFKFNGYETIEKNYSQVMQDMFVLMMHNGKKKGFYLEIGAADPIKGNNTYLLEKEFDWKGISIEINETEVAKWKGVRDNRILCRDASIINYDMLLKEVPADIDYLQVDCEPPSKTYEILTSLPFDTHRFAVITFEHDFYADASRKYKKLSREFLIQRGYVLIAGDISADGKHSFEDWWVHPELVNKDITDIMFFPQKYNALKADEYLLSF
jgi:hypothetical protein